MRSEEGDLSPGAAKPLFLFSIGMTGWLFTLLLLSEVLAGCASLERWPNPWEVPGAGPSTPGPSLEKGSVPVSIRVAIALKRPSVHLQAPEEFELSGFPWSAPTAQGQERAYREVTLTAEKLHSGKAFIRPTGEGRIFVDGRGYEGTIEVMDTGHGSLTLINELPLEDYVMGVLAGEVPGNGPLEALKAQAIAARTFALWNRLQAKARNGVYDLENTAFYQMYQGSDRVTDVIRMAVRSTEGEIVSYDNRPITAFFHSNCGGRTADAATVWNKDQPYLRSVACRFGDQGSHFRWTAVVKIEDLLRKLRDAGVRVSDLAELRVLSRDEGNRVLRLELRDSGGSRVVMKGSAFRMAIGPDIVRSTGFEADLRDDEVRFSGRGWGHGVGLCQEGAFGMARQGYSAFDILRHYYRGVMVEKMDRYLSAS